MDFSWMGSTIIQNIILFFTLLAAVSIGIKQNTINESLQDAALKPVILRDGVIHSWDELKSGSNAGKALVFSVQKNIALDITGSVIAAGKKYRLDFGIGTQVGSTNKYSCQMLDSGRMGWIKPDGILCATFNPESFTPTELPNQISLTYHDTQGNAYYTREDAEFRQTAGKLSSR